MRTCWLRISGEEDYEYEVTVTGYALISEGTHCAARRTNRLFRVAGWRQVRIGRYVDHVGGKCNRAGAVYEAEVLREYPPPERTGSLFG